jgi:cell division protease FtsH
VQGQYGLAKGILIEHQDELHRLAQALLEHETLNKEEIMAVIKGQKLTNVFYQ